MTRMKVLDKHKHSSLLTGASTPGENGSITFGKGLRVRPERQQGGLPRNPQEYQDFFAGEVSMLSNFFPSSLMMRPNKIEGLPLETLSSCFLEFENKA
jgi:hypothetical protein